MKLPQSLLSKLAVGGMGLALTVGCSVQSDTSVEQKTPVKQTKPVETPGNPTKTVTPETKTPIAVKAEKPGETECKVDPTLKQSPDRPADYCPGCGRG